MARLSAYISAMRSSWLMDGSRCISAALRRSSDVDEQPNPGILAPGRSCQVSLSLAQRPLQGVQQIALDVLVLSTAQPDVHAPDQSVSP